VDASGAVVVVDVGGTVVAVIAGISSGGKVGAVDRNWSVVAVVVEVQAALSSRQAARGYPRRIRRL
jgi:hypothetical protein